MIEDNEAEAERLHGSHKDAPVAMEEVRVEEIEEAEDVTTYAAAKPSKKKKQRNLNVEAAYLHVLGDLLNSIGVILAATIILIWPNLCRMSDDNNDIVGNVFFLARHLDLGIHIRK